MERSEKIKPDSENQEQDNELSYLRSALEYTEQENAKLNAELTSLSEILTKLRSQSNEADDDLVVLTDENEQLRAQVVKMIKDMDSLQKELNTSRDELHFIEGKNEKLSSLQGNNNEDLEKINSELDSVREKFELAKIENEKLRSQEAVNLAELTKLKNETDGFREKFELARGENEKLRSLEVSKSGELLQLQDEFKEFKKKFDVTKSENEKLLSQVNELEDLGKVQSELKEYQEKLTQSRAENEKLVLKEGAKAEELTNIQNNLKEFQEKFNQSEAENKKLRSQRQNESEKESKNVVELEKVNKSLKLLKEENEKLRSEEEKKSDVVSKHHIELKDLSKKLELAESENEKLRSQDIAKSESLKDLQVELNCVLDQLDEAKAEQEKSLSENKDSDKLRDFQTELENLQKELNESKRENQKLNSSNDVDSVKLKTELERTLEKLDQANVQNRSLGDEVKQQKEKIKELSDLVKVSKCEKSEQKINKETSAIKLDENSKSDDVLDYGVKRDETPTARVGKLRKYRGYRNPEEVKEDENPNLLELVKEYRDRIANGESVEEIALSIAQLNPEKLKGDSDSDENDKSKAYSPNRSFGELLEDSERRKVASITENVETRWTDDTGTKEFFLEGFNPEDIEPMPERSSIKPLLIAGVAAALALGIAGFFLFGNNPSDSATVLKEDVASESITTDVSQNPDDVGIVENSTNAEVVKNAQPEQSNEIRDLKSEDLKQEALDLLRSFHETKDLERKSSFCRVPVRTLETMRTYYTNRADVISVPGLRISPELITLGDLNIVKADVITKIGDVVGARLAFFEINQEGKLKLDWFNYVDNEAGLWDEYTQNNDVDPREWKVKVDFDGDEHPDFDEGEYAALRVRSFSTDAINTVNAYIKKSDPKYQDLLDAYQTGQQVFILKLSNLADDTGSFMVVEVVSLHSFYNEDIVNVTE